MEIKNGLGFCKMQDFVVDVGVMNENARIRVLLSESALSGL